jgi:D-ornithine 4,5-aminomutase subunit alpha
MPHPDDYLKRREHLSGLSDVELIARFWDQADRVVAPLIALARTHTSPSIERSVLLRMGFSSLEAKAIVTGCVEHGLLGHGAGHVVLARAHQTGLAYLAVGRALARGQGFDEAAELFGPTGPGGGAGVGTWTPRDDDSTGGDVL